jgi:MFS superfamily sulfate permease-like transporter
MLHLAIDLLNDSIVASRRALDPLEYSSILLVGSIVTLFGFVPGIQSTTQHSAAQLLCYFL